ncbi:MAG: TIGR03086 family metal-binding protein [Actinomycetota bacterium]|nr:TIGR03086 family metal-binding protein [Actinomycetota bacterium]
MTGIERDFTRSVRDFGEKVRAVGDGQWTNGTPCSEWDVRALVNHLVNEALWVKPLLEGQTIEEVGDRLDGDLLGEDPKAAFDRAAAEALAVAAEPGAVGRIVHISSGDAPAGQYLGQLFADFVVHGWDLARGIGVDDTIDAGYAAAIYEQMKPMENAMKSWGVYGDKIDAAGDADVQTRLLALFGRAQ